MKHVSRKFVFTLSLFLMKIFQRKNSKKIYLCPLSTFIYAATKFVIVVRLIFSYKMKLFTVIDSFICFVNAEFGKNPSDLDKKRVFILYMFSQTFECMQDSDCVNSWAF